MTVGLLTVVSTLCYLLVESISENAFLRFSFYSFYLSKLEELSVLHDGFMRDGRLLPLGCFGELIRGLGSALFRPNST